MAATKSARLNVRGDAHFQRTIVVDRAPGNNEMYRFLTTVPD
jgi:hypothetical protein